MEMCSPHHLPTPFRQSSSSSLLLKLLQKQNHRAVHLPAWYFPTASTCLARGVIVIIPLPVYPSLCAISPVHSVMVLGPAMALHGDRREYEAPKYTYKLLKYKLKNIYQFLLVILIVSILE